MVGSSTRLDRAGFSMIEAMVSAAVLGIGLTALVNAHISSIRGVDHSNESVIATSLAQQIADDFAVVQRGAAAPMFPAACDDLVPRNIQGCAADNGIGFAGVASGPCTRYFEEGALPGGGVSVFDGALYSSGQTTDPGYGFRVDIYASPHPDPSIDIADSRVIDVYVCWRDANSMGRRVREVHETRVVSTIY